MAKNLTIAKAAAEAEAKAVIDNLAKEEGRAVIVVRSISQTGRRRSGISFGSEPIEVDVATLTEDELAAVMNDPQLVVETR